MKIFVTFLLGFTVGIVSYAAINLLDSGKTEVWTSQVKLSSHSGVIIPEGTEFIVTEHMPEGFVALSLGINIEGDELNTFKKSTEDKPNLHIPVWLYKNQE